MLNKEIKEVEKEIEELKHTLNVPNPSGHPFVARKEAKLQTLKEIQEKIDKKVAELKKQINERLEDLGNPKNCVNIGVGGECKICDNLSYELKDELDRIDKIFGGQDEKATK